MNENMLDNYDLMDDSDGETERSVISNIARNQDLDMEVEFEVDLKEDDLEKDYKCTICLLRFKENAMFENHMLIEHSEYMELGRKLYKCRFCHKSYLSNPTLKAHEQKKHDECSLCGAKFVEKGNLSHHIQTVHGKRNAYEFVISVRCTICDKRFSDKSRLEYHKLIHKKIAIREGTKMLKFNREGKAI